MRGNTMTNGLRAGRQLGVGLLLLGAALPLWAETPVRSTPLAELLVQPEQSAPAQVMSLNDSQIGAELMARIETIAVRVGDRVQPGELLVSLDCRSYRAELAQRQAALGDVAVQLELADSQLQRALRLRQQRNLSEEELERRQAEQRGLMARRESLSQQQRQAALQVERCRILAPFAGVVRERLAQLGELTTPGRALIRLQQLDALEVSAQLQSEVDLSAVAELFFDYQGRRYPLTLRRVVPAIDSRGHTREVRLTFSGEASAPGSSGRLVWVAQRAMLPGDLLVRRGDTLGVMLVVDGRAHFQPLPGAQEGQPVVAELDPDSRVISSGRHGLSEGEAVVERP